MIIRVTLSIDHANLLNRLQTILEKMEILTTVIPRSSFTVDFLARTDTDLVFVSRSIIADWKYEEIESIRNLNDRPEIIVMIDRENADERARFIAAGVFAVLYSGLSDDSLGRLVKTVVARRTEGMRHAVEVTRSLKKNKLSDFVSSSPVMNTFLEVVKRIVDTDTTLLMLGETGVGKEHLARAIHGESRRSRGAFIALNCGALPETLLESELFGHEEGAFTGANKSMRGQFELAHQGTIFLDEIAEMPLSLQVKLLHVLEQRQIRRLGGEKLIPINVRIMAATNRNLTEEIAQKRFRLDLYYRLSALTLNIPPLRERREDIPELIDNYLAHFCATTNKYNLSLHPSSLDAMVRYDWPGNVRELINVIERATLLSTGNTIFLKDLPLEISGRSLPVNLNESFDKPIQNKNAYFDELTTIPMKSARDILLTEFETYYISTVMLLAHGRVGEAARLAGISPRTLFEKMQALGLSKGSFRKKIDPH